MQTLKQFLQELSYKEDKDVSRSAKGLLQALKRGTAKIMLAYKIEKEEATKEP